MGKVLGGGSSINVMAWARGHKNDWDCFASESGDPAWGYDSVLYGIQNLRIADGSIMPRVTTGNTMAPCIIIGERAGEILRAAHRVI
jgi:choline dehydrogenase-like flavoprotein